MMNEQNDKKPLRKPEDFPQLGAATLKDACFDVPKPGTKEWELLQADVKGYEEAKKAGRIPQYPNLAPPGW